MSRKGIGRSVRVPVIDRVLPRVRHMPSGCWEWTGADNGCGYGVVGSGGKESRILYVHRVMYEHMREPIPEGLQIDHLCRNRRCCNPDHLEVVTIAENVARGNARLTSGRWRAEFERAKTRCPAGHAYDSENTYVTPKGHRQCRVCKTAAVLRYRAKKKATV